MTAPERGPERTAPLPHLLAASPPALTVAQEDPVGHDVVAFLSEHVAQMAAVSPPGSCHALDAEGLRGPGVTFWAARSGEGALLGCAALRRIDATHAELKSMRTAALRRRAGVGTALLAEVLEHARAAGYSRVSLETGAQEFFAPAVAFYRANGFVPCPPFDTYAPDPNSVFLARAL